MGKEAKRSDEAKSRAENRMDASREKAARESRLSSACVLARLLNADAL